MSETATEVRVGCRTPWIAHKVAWAHGDGKTEVGAGAEIGSFFAFVRQADETKAINYALSLPVVKMPGHYDGVLWEWPIDAMKLAGKQESGPLARTLSQYMRSGRTHFPGADRLLRDVDQKASEIREEEGHGGHMGAMIHYWCELARAESHPCRRRALFSKAREWATTGSGPY